MRVLLLAIVLCACSGSDGDAVTQQVRVSAKPPSGTREIWLRCGDSNVAGLNTDITELDASYGPTSIDLADAQTSIKFAVTRIRAGGTTQTAWTDLGPTAGAYRDGDLNSNASELAFGYWIHRLRGNVGILQYGDGGTRLSEWKNTIGATARTYFNTRIADLGESSRVIGLTYWDSVPEAAGSDLTDWVANLTTLVGAFRTAYGANMRVIVGGIHPEFDNAASVNASIAAYLATDPLAATFSVADLTGHSGSHFDQADHATIGEREYASAQSVLYY